VLAEGALGELQDLARPEPRTPGAEPRPRVPEVPFRGPRTAPPPVPLPAPPLTLLGGGSGPREVGNGGQWRFEVRDGTFWSTPARSARWCEVRPPGPGVSAKGPPFRPEPPRFWLVNLAPGRNHSGTTFCCGFINSETDVASQPLPHLHVLDACRTHRPACALRARQTCRPSSGLLAPMRPGRLAPRITSRWAIDLRRLRRTPMTSPIRRHPRAAREKLLRRPGPPPVERSAWTRVHLSAGSMAAGWCCSTWVGPAGPGRVADAGGPVLAVWRVRPGPVVTASLATLLGRLFSGRGFAPTPSFGSRPAGKDRTTSAPLSPRGALLAHLPSPSPALCPSTWTSSSSRCCPTRPAEYWYPRATRARWTPGPGPFAAGDRRACSTHAPTPLQDRRPVPGVDPQSPAGALVRRADDGHPSPTRPLYDLAYLGSPRRDPAGPRSDLAPAPNGGRRPGPCGNGYAVAGRPP